MKVAVWDTYVTKKGGSVMHFDIIVSADTQNSAIIYAFGKNYLEAMQVEGKIEFEECQFCHIETPTVEMQDAIQSQGYFILEMPEIPAQLPALPTRKDIIAHLRGHYPHLRFTNFQDKSLSDIQQLLKSVESDYVPIDCNFYDVLLAKVTERVYCKIQYFYRNLRANNGSCTHQRYLHPTKSRIYVVGYRRYHSFG